LSSLEAVMPVIRKLSGFVRTLVYTAIMVTAVTSCDVAPGEIPAPMVGVSLRGAATIAVSAVREERRLSHRIGEVTPNFGGMFLDPSGGLTVYLKDGIPAAAAIATVRAELAASGRSEQRIVIRRANYGWSELQQFREAALLLHDVPGVAWTGVDETRNGITIAVVDAAAASVVMMRLRNNLIPESAVEVVTAGVPTRLQSLGAYARPMPGGVRFEAIFNGAGRNACTATANATRVGQPGQFLVVASHCTQDTPPEWGWIGAGIYQPLAPTYVSDSAQYIIGREVFDPAGFTGASNGCAAILNECRYSDAALVDVLDGMNVEQGYIARPSSGPAYLPTIDGDTIISTSTPRITITGVQSDVLSGDTLEKVGIKTGWTAGTLYNACADLSITDASGNTHTLLCQLVNTMSVDAGDSGSPVFWRNTAGDYYLVGLMWGGAGMRTQSVQA
jgi:hypothetical protein